MAYGLDTDSFQNAFYCMANRRGLPKEMISAKKSQIETKRIGNKQKSLQLQDVFLCAAH